MQHSFLKYTSYISYTDVDLEKVLILKPLPKAEPILSIQPSSSTSPSYTHTSDISQRPHKKVKREKLPMKLNTTTSTSTHTRTQKSTALSSEEEAELALSSLIVPILTTTSKPPPTSTTTTHTTTHTTAHTHTTHTISTTTTIPYDELQLKINLIFSYFWNLEITDTLVNIAYFGRINEDNYKEFGFDVYYNDFINLLYIKVSI